MSRTSAPTSTPDGDVQNPKPQSQAEARTINRPYRIPIHFPPSGFAPMPPLELVIDRHVDDRVRRA
ncbi:hypothetical protein, partial [Burkholderia pseudomallei]|uniref:hypothetical protein n=1 Tax=Burkholderia pseudomallei TaxID=28450 RepID=UPI001C9AFB72